VLDRVDVITSTLGKALGGGSGGFTTGRKEVVELLRQRSRPYLFSNTVAPPIVGAALAVFDILDRDSGPRERVMANTKQFREGVSAAGFNIKRGTHPIVPVMIGDAKLATALADELLDEGIYVIGFSYPVVPKGEARVRVQLSAAHSTDDVAKAVDAFTRVGTKLGIV
jgi:glycine C-acetyltransferase